VSRGLAVGEGAGALGAESRDGAAITDSEA
jgi:hypothetical protein